MSNNKSHEFSRDAKRRMAHYIGNVIGNSLFCLDQPKADLGNNAIPTSDLKEPQGAFLSRPAHHEQRTKAITAIVIGIFLVVAMGGIGITALSQAYGVHMPQCLEWVTPISQTHNAWGAWTMATCGTVLGTILIVVASKKYQFQGLRNALANVLETNKNDLTDAEWKTLLEIIPPINPSEVTDEDTKKLGYDPLDQLNLFGKNNYQNHAIHIFHFITDEPGETYDDYAYFIKLSNGTVLPTICIPVADVGRNDTFKSLMGKLGYNVIKHPDKIEPKEEETANEAAGIHLLKEALTEGLLLNGNILQDDQWQTLNKMVVLNHVDDDRIKLDLSDEIERYRGKEYIDGTVDLVKYEEGMCCFFIKNFKGNVFPTIMKEYNEQMTNEISNFLTNMEFLGYDIDACVGTDDNASSDGE